MNTSMLGLNETKLPIKYIIIMMILAYSFSIFARMDWVNYASNIEAFKWNNEVMINTNDGYYYAQGAKDILNGTKLYISSPIETITSKMTALLVSILPFSIDTIILHMPSFLSSLLIVPLIMIGYITRLPYLGFIAAIIAPITWSYYNRTMAGYYDTDMLIVVWPTLVLFALMASVVTKQYRYLIILAIFMLLNIYWHGGGASYNIALSGIMFLYTIAFDRKNIFLYQILSIVLICSSFLSIEYSLIICMLLIAFFKYEKFNNIKIMWGIFIFSAVIFMYFGGLQGLWDKFNTYVFRILVADDDALSFQFYNVIGTVREAGGIHFDLFARRISGSVDLFYLASIGLIALMIRYKVFLLSLPLLAIGFIAMQGGLRFTIFAVPVYALGISYLILLFIKFVNFLLNEFVKNKNILSKINKPISVIIASLSTAYIANINMEHIKSYKVPTVFSKSEVQILKNIDNISNTKDYTISWWDYGYPIRYYANTQTLIDGGNHDGSVNFPVSFALTNPLLASVNMLRNDVEYTENKLKNPRAGSNIANMVKDYGYTSSQEFLRALNTKRFKPLKASRDIYLYLPFRMADIFPTVALFSEMDIGTGQVFPRKMFYKHIGFNKLPDNILDLGRDVKFDIVKNIVILQGRKYPLHHLAVTEYDNAGKLHKKEKVINENSKINLIYMKNYNTILLMEDKLYNSTYVQLFMLENYDQNLIEPVILNPKVKVFRLKI